MQFFWFCFCFLLWLKCYKNNKDEGVRLTIELKNLNQDTSSVFLAILPYLGTVYTIIISD